MSIASFSRPLLHLPMSSAQVNIWLEQSLHPQSTQFVISTYYLIPLALDVDRFIAAANWVFSHYSALYARLTWGGGEVPELVFDPGLAPTCSILDLSSENNPENALQELVRRQASTPFRILDNCLSRAMLVRTGQRSFCLISNYHHILMDGWGAGIVFPRIIKVYEDLGNKREPGIEGGEYTDCLGQSRKPLEKCAFEKALEFWKPLLAAPMPSVPSVHACEPGEDEQSASHVVVTLSRELADKVFCLAAASNATLFHALLLAYGYLVGKQFSLDTCALSLPILNRSSEHKETIGLFTELRTTPLPLDEHLSVAENLNAIARRIKGLFRHYRLPMAELTKLYHSQDNSGNLRSHSVVTYLTKDFGVNFEGEFLPMMNLPSPHQKTPLTLYIFDTYPGQDIQIKLAYQHSCLNRVEAELFVHRLPHLLEGFALDPQRPLCDFELAPTLERQQIDSALRRPQDSRLAPRLVLEAIMERVQRNPDATAVEDQDSRHSFRECWDKANAMARALVREHSVRPGDRVILLLPRGADLVASYLAVMMVGATFVPLDPQVPEARGRKISQDCEAKCVLTNARLEKKAREIHSAVLVADSIAKNSESLAILADLDQIAYIIYTSGSIGVPKGVEISQRALAEHTASWLKSVPLREARERVLFFSSPAFDVSIETVFPNLILCNTLVVAPHPQWNFYELAGEIMKRRLSALYLPPAYLLEFLKHMEGRAAQLRGHSVHLGITGGDAMHAEIGRLWDDVFGASALLMNIYGPTEVTVSCCAFPKPFGFRAELGQFIPIGRAYDGRILRIVDQRGKDVPIGTEGELMIGGIGLARGYHRMPVETQERFVRLEDGLRYYRSGDVVRLRSDGNIAFCRRLDQQVKVRGFRVELREIEACLLEDRAVQECAVIACDRDRDGDKELRAFVVFFENSGQNSHALRESLLKRLPDYMVPTLIVVDQLPKSIAGKIDRKALSAWQDATDNLGSVEPVANPPRGPVQEYLSKLWEQALGRKVKDVQADFFELGGHSLLAAKLISKIGKSFRVDYPFPVFFDKPTIGDAERKLEQLVGNRAALEKMARLRLELSQLNPEEIQVRLANARSIGC